MARQFTHARSALPMASKEARGFSDYVTPVRLLPELHSEGRRGHSQRRVCSLSLSTTFGAFDFAVASSRPNVFRFLASAAKKTYPTKEFRSGPIRTKVSHCDQCLILLWGFGQIVMPASLPRIRTETYYK
jgi:hypothetical protein